MKLLDFIKSLFNKKLALLNKDEVEDVEIGRRIRGFKKDKEEFQKLNKKK